MSTRSPRERHAILLRALVAWWLICMRGGGASPTVRAQQSPLTFTKDIAPIVWNRCASCHRPGEIGPFSLLTYADVKRHVSQIAAVTSRGIMPPWKAEPDVDGFEGERRLTGAELERLQAWIAAGAIEGAPSDLPAAPKWEAGWQLGTPDLIVRMPAPYTVVGDGPDVFRTFVIPIPLAAPRYVRAIEFRPGNARVVHHANLGVDRTQASRQLDLRDPEPGYAGNMGLEARYPEGQLLGWTPGQVPHASPRDMAWRIDPGSDLVAQLHLQPTGKPESVQVSVGFYFTDKPPGRTPIGLRLGSETIDIAAGQSDYIVSDHYMLPVDVDLFAVQPHAHNLARRMEATATLPDGSARRLITIRDWDFRWQDVYRYKRPIPLSRGTTIAMTYAYDNTAGNVRNPHRPPVRVLWGQNTTDEMGDLWLQIAARTGADHDVLADDVRRKARAEDVKAYTTLLRRNPRDPLRHDAVASLYFDDGRVDEAIAEYTESLQLDPNSAASQYNLGIALSVRGHRDEAIAAFESALRINPDYAQAHNNLGALLHLLGRTDQAVEHYRRAIALRPDNLEAHANLGVLFSGQNRQLEAVHEFRAALALNPDSAQALSGLAWILATTADDSLRNTDEAVQLAQRAVQSGGRRDIAVFDALAAACAAAGRFNEAVAAAREGIQLAADAGMRAVVAQFQDRLRLYESGQPFRQPKSKIP